ncbi:predicted protein [Naegleria gruberi]|uniref:Succinate dehydrogenase assembly factor 3 n=1 Tax=Naegleria gruberi TaxID=5762 RepID=D2VA52_NAEGR|nr:uncharacterized protein NAEGRDRAFT_65741 [Naegleria gruberi]EFC46248.1 predicted protein [Naegleria gruberi]|eukprot:XP_002678992.1 predicted protein [Naegleria gruberi strain NEG-M]
MPPLKNIPYFTKFTSDLPSLPFRTMEWKYTCLSLYRNILRQHKYKLVPQQRFLGDAYVKNEFKLNKTGDENYARSFVEEWAYYYRVLEESPSPDRIGKDISEDDFNTLSKEQQEQFYQLKEETEKVKDYLKEQAKPNWKDAELTRE